MKIETELICEINMFRRLPPIGNFYRFWDSMLMVRINENFTTAA